METDRRQWDLEARNGRPEPVRRGTTQAPPHPGPVGLADPPAIVLSHGHLDHTTGMDGLMRTLGPANLPVFLHPEAWSRRRLVLPGREPFELPTPSKSAIKGAGFEIIEEKQPSFLLDGSLLITGEVDRTTEFEKGMPIQQAWRNGEWQPDPLVLDDQAAILNVRGKGLVVITGCGHAGIVNILRYARKLTGIERVYAVLGGFHLGYPFDVVIPQVCDALAELDPQDGRLFTPSPPASRTPSSRTAWARALSFRTP